MGEVEEKKSEVAPDGEPARRPARENYREQSPPIARTLCTRRVLPPIPDIEPLPDAIVPDEEPPAVEPLEVEPLPEPEPDPVAEVDPVVPEPLPEPDIEPEPLARVPVTSTRLPTFSVSCD